MQKVQEVSTRVSPHKKLWYYICSQNIQAMVDLKLWFQSDLLNVTKV